MAIEIERKFLIHDDSWREGAPAGLPCKQGYLTADGTRTVRVRIMGATGYLTIKGATSNISRMEFEYEIPLEDADALLKLCENCVEKTRYLIPHAGMTWELDVFEGANAGLVMAEIELEAEDQAFEKPDWAGDEVSGNKRYYNAYLSRHPYSEWT